MPMSVLYAASTGIARKKDNLDSFVHKKCRAFRPAFVFPKQQIAPFFMQNAL
jgi:hypothetical protein